MTRRPTVRERLAGLLQKSGYYIEPECLPTARGWWRINQKSAAVASWSGFATVEGRTIHLHSDYSMTECLAGIVVRPSENGIQAWVFSGEG